MKYAQLALTLHKQQWRLPVKSFNAMNYRSMSLTGRNALLMQCKKKASEPFEVTGRYRRKPFPASLHCCKALFYATARFILLPVMICLLTSISAFGTDADEIVMKSLDAFFYQGDDFRAMVRMKLISGSGKVREREMTMLRKDYGPAGGEQKYYIYFHRPADVKKMTFMVHKHPDRNDDRWLFVPAINMTRRIAARDKASSFVGSDFSYEDISGRDPEDDTHILEGEKTYRGRKVFVIKNVPRQQDVNYSYKISWIDVENYLPLKEEYYDIRGELMRIFTADKIEEIAGQPTITKRTMKNVQSGHRTEVEFLKAEYNIGIDDRLFSERYLKRPPVKWIR